MRTRTTKLGFCSRDTRARLYGGYGYDLALKGMDTRTVNSSSDLGYFESTRVLGAATMRIA